MEMTRDVETYFLEGCGRCKLGATPECKVHQWAPELRELRRLAQKTNLQEECKWGVPCYTLSGKNVLIISAFKDSCVVSFLKGILLEDSKGLLEKSGPHSHADRLMRFTDLDQIIKLAPEILAYMNEAIMIQEAGIQVPPRTNQNEEIPEELIHKFDEDPSYKTAFESLTPGRQRSYLLHIGGAKQVQTRINRIEKCKDKIFLGKGFNEY